MFFSGFGNGVKSYFTTLYANVKPNHHLLGILIIDIIQPDNANAIENILILTILIYRQILKVVNVISLSMCNLATPFPQGRYQN